MIAFNGQLFSSGDYAGEFGSFISGVMTIGWQGVAMLITIFAGYFWKGAAEAAGLEARWFRVWLFMLRYIAPILVILAEWTIKLYNPCGCRVFCFV